MQFQEPDETGGIRINPKDTVGHLMLIWATDYIPHSPTQFTRPDKPSDVIVVDVVDLDQVDDEGVPGLLARKVWWRQAQLIAALKGKIGDKDPMLVRMGRGGATMGRNAPFVLNSVTSDPQCVQRAYAWINNHSDFTPSGPGPKPVEQAVGGQEPAESRTPHQQVLRDAEQMHRETYLEQLARQAMPPARPQSAQPDIPPY
jgi:hypothetical protein